MSLADGVTDSKGDGQAKRLMKGLLSVVGSERKAADRAVRWSQCQAREGSAKECGLNRG